jgi:hypothetical protein
MLHMFMSVRHVFNLNLKCQMRQSVTISKVNVPNVIYKIHCFEFSANLTTLLQLIIIVFYSRSPLG